ncbi:beta-ketoacyl-[acyl-carrier-protein] synthase family protein [Planctomycetota bacterium]
MNKPVITGMGAVTPVGNSVPEAWEALSRGSSGLKEITLFDTSTLRNKNGGEIRGFPRDINNPRSLRFLEKAVEESLQSGNIYGEEKVLQNTGFSFGTNFGCANSFAHYYTNREKDPEEAEQALGRYPFEYFVKSIQDSFGIKGSYAAVSTACASGLAVIDTGIQLLEHTDAEIVICAAVDELALYSYAGLNSLRAITTDVIRPFTKNRKGTQFSEGAGAVVIEYEDHALARNAKPLARIEGVYVNNDAFHTTAPDTEARGITAVMEKVFEQSGVSKEKVTYVNAHGTGTKYNDVIETKALKNVFGPHANNLYIDAIKSMTGHEMGAAGIIELISAVMTIQTGVIPPTVNFDEPDEECDLNYCTGEKIETDVEYAMTNSYGIGGANGSVLLSAFRG